MCRHVPAATLRAPLQHGEYTWIGVILARVRGVY